MSVAAAVAESSEMAGGGLVAAAGKCLAAPESDKASHPTLLETARSWRGILVFTHLAREGRMTVTIDGGELLAALGGAVAAWPLAARGQQTATPVVGFVSGMSSSASERQAAAFLKGLSETGYLEGQNMAVEYHWLNGQYDQLPITYG